MNEAIGAVETNRVRLTATGRALGAFVFVGFLPALALGGAVALLPALALSLLVCGAVGSWLNLRRVVPSAGTARRVFVGQRFDLPVRLANRSTSHTARDVLLFHGDHGRDQATPAAYAASIPATSEEVLSTRHRLLERGPHDAYRVTLVSSFPLGLVERRTTWLLPAEFLALPRLGSVRRVESHLPRWRGHQAETRRTLPGSEEFFGLRQWREGESQHLVHWKISARQGKTILRELRGEDRPPVHLVLDPHVRLRASMRRHRGFEEAISLAGTLAESLLRQRYRVRFTILGEDGCTIDCEAGRYGLLGLLDQLALVQPRQLERAADGPALHESRTGEVRAIVRSGSGAGHAADATTVVFDVDDRAIERFFEYVRDRADPDPGQAA